MHKLHTQKLHKKTAYVFSAFLMAVALAGCGAPSGANPSGEDSLIDEWAKQNPSSDAPGESDIIVFGQKDEQPEETVTTKGSRDNTPACLIPSADGTRTDGNELVTLDISHMDCGYFMAQYLGTNHKVKMQVTGPNGVTYTYNLSSEFEVFPFAAGNGSYNVGVFENVEGTQYAAVFNNTYDVTITDEFSPYLYPNQYVNFNESSQVVSLASELAFPANDDLTVVTNIYNYIISNVSYDYDKATNVESSYIPVVDELLTTQKGICFDFASAMASMLRSQRIPTRLEIGYAGDAYHAWISTYLDETGWVNGIIEFDGHSWKLMDPTFAAGSSEEQLKDFIGDGSNYVTKYIY